MSDENDLDPELNRLRSVLVVAPPLGAKSRVQAAVMMPRPRRRAVPPRLAVLVTMLLLAAAAGATALIHRAKTPPQQSVAAASPPAPSASVERATEALSASAAAVSVSDSATDNVNNATDTIDSSAAPVPSQRASAPHPPGSSSEGPSALAQQVEAYRSALSLIGKDDDAALARLRAFKSKWPRSALAHEADLRIVEILVRLGRRDQAKDAARDFVKAHPESPKVDEVRAIGGQGGGAR
jgi:hypothetical protein